MFRLKHTRTLRLTLLLGLYENLTKQKTLFIVKNMSFLSPSILTTQGPFSPVPCSPRTTALRCHLQKEKAINPIPNGLGSLTAAAKARAARSQEKPELRKHLLPFPPCLSIHIHA